MRLVVFVENSFLRLIRMIVGVSLLVDGLALGIVGQVLLHRDAFVTHSVIGISCHAKGHRFLQMNGRY